MKRTNARRVALIGMLFALAMVLSFLENMFSGLFGLPPGVKLGLANVVVMYALLCLGAGDALLLAILKGVFGFLTRGALAGLLSLTGGVLSLGIMWLLCRLGQKKEYFIVSVAGALAHNAGQLLAVTLLTESKYTFYYAPVLLLAGLVMGALTALSLKTVLPALEKLGLRR